MLGVDHQADKENAAIRAAVLFHAFDGRRDDLVHHALLHGGIEDRRRRVGAHAASVGAGVAIANALVILSTGERDCGLAVAEGEEGGFLTVHELLDDERGGGCAELAAEHGVDFGFGFGLGFGNDDTLACGEAISLQHIGRAIESIEIGFGFGGLIGSEAAIAGCGDVVLRHEVFREAFRAFEHGGAS